MLEESEATQCPPLRHQVMDFPQVLHGSVNSPFLRCHRILTTWLLYISYQLVQHEITCGTLSLFPSLSILIKFQAKKKNKFF